VFLLLLQCGCLFFFYEGMLYVVSITMSMRTCGHFRTCFSLILCNRTFVENRKYVEVLVAVDTPWPGDFWRQEGLTES